MTKSPLDLKTNESFPGVVVRKDLVKAVKGNAIVPTYVLEYLLAQYAASDDPEIINQGIETVRSILAKHYVHRNEAELIKSIIREKGRHQIIDRISVTLNEKEDQYEASFENLGIRGVVIDSFTVKSNEKLLVSGVWCICTIEYGHTDDKIAVPWILSSLKAIQLASFDFEHYLSARRKYSSEEWVDLLVQSIGFNPELFGRRAKLLQLTRLIPFVERNYNLVELGPKGTGKSHVYSEFSPHGMLISGGEVTVPKLFVNNANNKIGLVGYWDVVAFDEFAGRKKKTDKALVDIMKNYMANKSFSRGVQTLGAEASMVFIGNTSHNVPYMLKHSDLFDELPAAYHDSAFLDRLHFYIPGWEVDTIRAEMFSDGYGFVVDYIAEVLRHMRSMDFSDKYNRYLTLSSEISTRDRDGIHKTFSGLMKLLYPTGEATEEETRELLSFAIEGRKRVKDQILRIDSTMPPVSFGFADSSDTWTPIETLEEKEYRALYHFAASGASEEAHNAAETTTSEVSLAQSSQNEVAPAQQHRTLEPGRREFSENETGVTYEGLFMDYLQGETDLILVDPFIRSPHQGRNLAEFLTMLASNKDISEELSVTLQTSQDDDAYQRNKQETMLEQIQTSAKALGVDLLVAYHDNLHDRWIRTNSGWTITLGRGLDIYQRFEGGFYSLAATNQAFRRVKAFAVTYTKD